MHVTLRQEYQAQLALQGRRQYLDDLLVCGSNYGGVPDSESCVVKGVQVSLSQETGLNFCKDCFDAYQVCGIALLGFMIFDGEDSLQTGSYVDIWPARAGSAGFHIDGALTYAVPNAGEGYECMLVLRSHADLLFQEAFESRTSGREGRPSRQRWRDTYLGKGLQCTGRVI